jgi:periplasmic protein TonB
MSLSLPSRAHRAVLLLAVGFLAGLFQVTAFAQSGATDSPQTVRVGGDVRPPLKVKNVDPVYPRLALSGKVQGVVILEATIGTDGKVKDVKVVKSLKLLDDAAVTAVREWEYKPTVINGHPVQVIMTIPVNFTL